MKDTEAGISRRLHYAPYYRIAAEQNGECVGYVFAYLIGDPIHQDQKKRYLYIDDLRVSESMRGKGFGRKLMEDAVALAKKERCYKVVANSHRKLKAARALYAEMGFVPHGREFRLDL
ncbi:MAG: hypothetical protein A3D65_01840 [Candidatus Lloydbacteria bacterium RIFCSPHIGHO2_02_FULL_50_13]|uniref:N-acetyltransferase domain-containing protein n=1 Tax=Candidatus Lloydbacteria bacterium RIFCSPHIGHO2_02_FULL_50_13 TaxID=1798661 RepID=A0A1G2D0W0_9BACT|nr:MAG: hypothetical protein A3D65_01840 [Candidatus Lloydbacteria bacterium RIFCSPHIGHO2_02_FULL_50_13]